MLSGFNTNVRHRGVLFHVQTEDSGRAHPHVITHLYHGGTILASDKSSYRDALEASDLVGQVRALMEKQHAAMLERLRGGELDDVVAERLGAQVFVTTKQPGASGHTQRTATGVRAGEGAARPEAAGGPDPERPLDELILDYLVESTRRTRRRKADPPDASRKIE